MLFARFCFGTSITPHVLVLNGVLDPDKAFLWLGVQYYGENPVEPTQAVGPHINISHGLRAGNMNIIH